MAGLQGPAVATGTTVIRVLAEGGAIPAGTRRDTDEVSSIEEAIALARMQRAGAPDDTAIIIEIAGGTHRLVQPVRLGPQDGGSPEHPLIVRGAPDGSSRIVASFPLVDAGWPAADVLARIPSSAREHVRAYRLPPSASAAAHADIPRRHVDRTAPSIPFAIFDGAGALQPARWPNEGWATVASAADDEDSATFAVTAESVSEWRNETDLWAAGYWKWNWSFETRPVGAVAAENATVTLAEPTHYGIVTGARYFIYHALSELDRPGEWVRTPDRQSVVVWPRPNGPALEVSIGESLFILDRARHVRFENLLFGRTRGDAIVVNGGTGIVVADSTISSTGGRGIVLEGAQRSGIEHCVVTETGAGGIELSAGDRTTLTPAGLFASRSRITRTGRLGRTYHPAVRISGVGNAVLGSLIADLPHSAVIFSGNDHRIEGNEITRVVQETSDAGAVYTGRDWTARGTEIRHNFLHDIRGKHGFETKGVYMDDMASGITVDHNLFLRVDQPVFIGGGRDNAVTGNLLVASAPAIHMDGRGTGWSKRAVEDAASELRRNLAAVPYRGPVWQRRYPDLASILDRQPGLPLGNRTRGNVVIGGSLYDLEGSAHDVATGLGPDSEIPGGEGGGVAALTDAASAAEIGRLSGASELTIAWPALPFAHMDRSGRVPSDPRPVN